MEEGNRDFKDLKIFVGCGAYHRAGWFNVDIIPNANADHFCDAGEIPLPDRCAELIEAIHVLEHIPTYRMKKVLTEWNRLLKSGGKLIVEVPDILRLCTAVLDNQEDREKRDYYIWHIYGNGSHYYQSHFYGFTVDRLEDLMLEHGFKQNSIEFDPIDSRRKGTYGIRGEFTKK